MKLELYILEECPYCNKVMKKISSMENIDIEIKDIVNNKYKEELIKIGGKEQVPCLIIDGKPMYESEDIINFLTSF